jgi:hypothetical protein
MTVEETLELARSHGVEISLNEAGDGVDLEVEADPPQTLVNILKRAKWGILATLRQREMDRRRPLITRWINDHFVSTPPDVCRHCGEGAREGDVFVRLFCGDDSGDVHASCQPAWQEVEETKARAALGLTPLTDPLDRHLPLLCDIEEARPPDATDAQWDAAMSGVRAFLASGRADEALRLGWPHDELFAVPPLWANVALCGAALLIGDREVTAVTADKIQIKSESGSILSFYRRPQPDYGLVYRERLKALRGLGGDEPHFRAFDFTVNFCREHSGCDLEQAKALVRAAIAKPAARSAGAASTMGSGTTIAAFRG